MQLRTAAFATTLIIVLGSGGAVAASEPIPWVLYERDCAESLPDPQVLCGDYGVFLFPNDLEDPDPSGCERADDGTEVDPPGYPQPNKLDGVLFTNDFDIWSNEPSVPFGGAGARLQGRGKFGGLSKAGFGPPGGETGDQPWVAVVDWGDNHGRAVATIIGSLLEEQAQVSVLPLDSEDLAFLGEGGVTDFHVLARVCEMAELVDRQGVVPPRVVNMSFGRLPEEPLEQTLDADYCLQPTQISAESRGISCQLGQVIEHLRASGTTFVAAMGNHGQPLIPADSVRVLGAGAMDIAHYQEQGEVVPSWETPLSGYQALFPADGLCLPNGEPIAAGTSFSAAVASGWIGAALGQMPDLDPLATGLWTPTALSPSDLEGCAYLAKDGQPLLPFCSRAASQMMRRLGACWSKRTNTDAAGVSNGLGEAEVVIAVGGPPREPESQPSMQSFDEWVAEHQPAPEPDFCVPCQGGGGGLSLLRTPADPSKREIRRRNMAVELLMQPGVSTHLPAGQQLVSLYFRVGRDFYPIPLSQDQLDQLAQGEVDRLILQGYKHLVDRYHQPSLVTVVDAGGGDGQFWSSTPLILP